MTCPANCNNVAATTNISGGISLPGKVKPSSNSLETTSTLNNKLINGVMGSGDGSGRNLVYGDKKVSNQTNNSFLSNSLWSLSGEFDFGNECPMCLCQLTNKVAGNDEWNKNMDFKDKHLEPQAGYDMKLPVVKLQCCQLLVCEKCYNSEIKNGGACPFCLKNLSLQSGMDFQSWVANNSISKNNSLHNSGYQNVNDAHQYLDCHKDPSNIDSIPSNKNVNYLRSGQFHVQSCHKNMPVNNSPHFLAGSSFPSHTLLFQSRHPSNSDVNNVHNQTIDEFNNSIQHISGRSPSSIGNEGESQYCEVSGLYSSPNNIQFKHPSENPNVNYSSQLLANNSRNFESPLHQVDPWSKQNLMNSSCNYSTSESNPYVSTAGQNINNFGVDMFFAQGANLFSSRSNPHPAGGNSNSIHRNSNSYSDFANNLSMWGNKYVNCNQEMSQNFNADAEIDSNCGMNSIGNSTGGSNVNGNSQSFMTVHPNLGDLGNVRNHNSEDVWNNVANDMNSRICLGLNLDLAAAPPFAFAGSPSISDKKPANTIYDTLGRPQEFPMFGSQKNNEYLFNSNCQDDVILDSVNHNSSSINQGVEDGKYELPHGDTSLVNASDEKKLSSKVLKYRESVNSLSNQISAKSCNKPVNSNTHKHQNQVWGSSDSKLAYGQTNSSTVKGVNFVQNREQVVVTEVASSNRATNPPATFNSHTDSNSNIQNILSNSAAFPPLSSALNCSKAKEKAENVISPQNNKQDSTENEQSTTVFSYADAVLYNSSKNGQASLSNRSSRTSNTNNSRAARANTVSTRVGTSPLSINSARIGDASTPSISGVSISSPGTDNSITNEKNSNFDKGRVQPSSSGCTTGLTAPTGNGPKSNNSVAAGVAVPNNSNLPPSNSSSNQGDCDKSGEPYNYKRALCRHWMRGYCWLEGDCKFAHGETELRTREGKLRHPQNSTQAPCRNSASSAGVQRNTVGDSNSINLVETNKKKNGKNFQTVNEGNEDLGKCDVNDFDTDSSSSVNNYFGGSKIKKKKNIQDSSRSNQNCDLNVKGHLNGYIVGPRDNLKRDTEDVELKEENHSYTNNISSSSNSSSFSNSDSKSELLMAR